jgi:catechol 2,3-dioxygenase-like lactoylglutathione lyase family enzyme
MIKSNGVNHLALVTGDMDKTVRFWRDLLGFRLVAGLGRPGYRHYFFELSATDLVAFFEWPGARPIPEWDHGRARTGPLVFDHVSFGVETQAALFELRARLDAAGLWVSEVIDHGFIHSIYAFDPNGVPIEFSWNVPGVDIRARPMMRDRAPSAVTLEGPEPRPGQWPEPDPADPDLDQAVYPGQGWEAFGPDFKAD